MAVARSLRFSTTDISFSFVNLLRARTSMPMKQSRRDFSKPLGTSANLVSLQRSFSIVFSFTTTSSRRNTRSNREHSPSNQHITFAWRLHEIDSNRKQALDVPSARKAADAQQLQEYGGENERKTLTASTRRKDWLTHTQQEKHKRQTCLLPLQHFLCKTLEGFRSG